jgi:hypothetical protein
LHYFTLEHEKGKDERKRKIAKNGTASKSFAEYHKDLRHSVQKMGEFLCTMQVKLHIFPRKMCSSNFSKPLLAECIVSGIASAHCIKIEVIRAIRIL